MDPLPVCCVVDVWSLSVTNWVSGAFWERNYFHLPCVYLLSDAYWGKAGVCVCVSSFEMTGYGNTWVHTHSYSLSYILHPTMFEREFAAAAKDSTARARISIYSAVIGTEFSDFPEKRILSWKLFCALTLSGNVNKACCWLVYSASRIKQSLPSLRDTHTHTHAHADVPPHVPPPPDKEVWIKREKHSLMPSRPPLNFTFKSIFQKALASNSFQHRSYSLRIFNAERGKSDLEFANPSFHAVIIPWRRRGSLCVTGNCVSLQ